MGTRSNTVPSEVLPRLSGFRPGEACGRSDGDGRLRGGNPDPAGEEKTDAADKEQHGVDNNTLFRKKQRQPRWTLRTRSNTV